MNRFRVVWADDEWPGAGSGTAECDMSSVVATINDKLREHAIFIDWVLCSTAEEALAEVDRAEVETQLVILDYRFAKGSKFGWPTVWPALLRRSIPCVLFSNFPSDIHRDPLFPKEHRLFLGMFPKHGDGPRSLSARVVQFFRARPIRLLHLTDIHYVARPTEDAAVEQSRLHAELRLVLSEEQKLRSFDAVMITGDLAGHDPPSDLAESRRLVMDIVEATIGSGRIHRLFVVPGNHDLVWQDFRAKTLAPAPWQPYLDFYQSIYTGRLDIFARMIAWNSAARLFDHKAHRDDLSWRARDDELGIDVFGFVSPSDNPALQGRGEISRQQIEVVTRAWKDPRHYGEVRIALTHHNLLKVLSVSPYDEKDLVVNGGEVLLALMKNQCGLVLSGHTHTPNLFSLHAAHCRKSALATTGAVTLLSAGTLGGFHSARDRERSFNVIDIGSIADGTQRRPLSVKSFAYDSTEGVWRTAPSAYAEDWLVV